MRRFQNFVSKAYWEIKTNYRGVIFNSTSGRFESVEDASKIIEEIKNKSFRGNIVRAKKKEMKAPPKLFDLTSLQVECNKKYSFTADDTLKYIQSLYEKKMVTYPRVDTTFFTHRYVPQNRGYFKEYGALCQLYSSIVREIY